MTEKEFRKIVKQIPPSHPDTEWSFRTECIRGKYLIYDGKKNRAICTNCGHEFDIAPGEYSHMHGHQDICPCCEAEVVCRSAGLGRRNLQELHRLMTFASDGKNLWIIQNDVVVRFEDFDRAQLYRKMVEVFKINAEEQKHWRFRDGYWSGYAYWDEIKSFNTAPLPTAPYYATKWQQHIFKVDIEDIVANSDCRYLMGDEFMKAMRWTRITSWIALQMKYPALELLYKGGFPGLAKCRLNGRNYMNAINIRATSIEKALRLPKKWVKALRRAGIGETLTPKQLKAFQRSSDKNRQSAIENWKGFANLVGAYGDHWITISKYTTIDRYLKYMKGQEQNNPGFYTDYIGNAEALGWDLRKKSVLFPPNLMEAHDRAADLRDMEKNSEIDKKISAHAIDIEFSTDDLTIICAKSQGALNKESRHLSHCVRTYGDRVAEGRTLIYFVRKRNEVDTPYYTLEISPKTGEVIQCRGLENCSMTPEVKEFRDGFEKAFKKYLKNKNRKTATVKSVAREGRNQILCPAM